MRSIAGALLMIVALAGPSVADEMYRWKDASGGLHFENVPTPERAQRREEAAAADAAAEGSGGQDAALDGGETQKKKMTNDEMESFETEMSARRDRLQRELRGTETRLRQIDDQLATLERARRKNTRGSAATGGVAAPANIPSPEEETLAEERDELAQRAVEVRNDAVELRQEVEARLGTVPEWWTDLR